MAKLRRICAIKRFVIAERKLAKTCCERLVLSMSFSLKLCLNGRLEKTTARSESIIGRFFVDIREQLFLREKTRTYLARVISIQRQWRMIHRKRRLFVEFIKKLWSENMVNVYYDLLEEKTKEEGNKPGTFEKRKFIKF